MIAYRLFAFIFMILMLSGCNALMTVVPDDQYKEFSIDSTNRISGKPTVRFRTVEDAGKECGSLTGYKKALGCARYTSDGSSCEIIVSSKTSMAIIGHELRHCFEGDFH